VLPPDDRIGIARAADNWPNKPVRYINVFPAGRAPNPSRESSASAGRAHRANSSSTTRAGRAAMSAPTPSPRLHRRPTRSASTPSPRSRSRHALRQAPFDVDKDFTAVAMMWSVAQHAGWCARSPRRTVPELTALAKANSRNIILRLVRPGTTASQRRDYKQLAGLNLLHVPIAAARPPIQDLLRARST